MTRKHKKVKRKQGPKTIPLSLVDHCLYWIGFLFVIGLGIFLSVFPEVIISRVVFSDPDVVAYSAGHIVLRVPFVFYVTLSLFIFLLFAYEERRVILGHKKGKYNPPVWEKERPLFSKKKNSDVSDDKPFYRSWFGMRIIVLCTLCIIYVFSFSFGWRINKDNILHKYILYGIETESCPVSSVREMEISIKRHYKKRTSDDYSIRIVFTTEGFRTARFSVGSFKGENFESCVKEILRLKSEVSAKKIQYSHLDLLENYFEDNRHTEVEQKFIYELFGLSNDDDREVSP